MSKAQLKKELESLSKEQIIEVVTDLYSLRKDAKEYFEYYLKPDVNALYRKYEEKIFKELRRVKRYHRREMCASRITNIKRTVKEFESFGSGKEWTVKLMFNVVESALILSSSVMYSEKYSDSLSSFLQDAMLEADLCGEFKPYAGRIIMLTKLDDSGVGTRSLRRCYIRALHEIGLETEYIKLLPPEKISKKRLTGL